MSWEDFLHAVKRSATKVDVDEQDMSVAAFFPKKKLNGIEYGGCWIRMLKVSEARFAEFNDVVNSR